MFTKAIQKANVIGSYSGICPQASPDFQKLAEYLIEIDIHSVSLTPNTVIPFLMRSAQ